MRATRTIVEGIVSPRWFYEPLRAALQGAEQAVAYVVLRAPLALCTSRAAGREAHPLPKASVIEQLWHEFSDLGVLERHVLDINDRGAMAIAEEIELRLAGGELSV